MLSAVGFPPGTVYFISAVNQDFPGTVTLTSIAEPYSFPIAMGQTVTISKVVGMYELNDNRYIVGSFNAPAMTFGLYTLRGNPVDTTNFNAYVSGGEVNIISYVPPPGEPDGLMYNNQ